jgi:hypothetical protein
VGALAGGTGGHFIGKTIQDMSSGIDQSLDQIAANAAEATKVGLMTGTFEGAARGPVGQFLERGINAVVEPINKFGRKIGNWLFVPKEQSEIVKKSEELLREAGGPGLTGGQLGSPDAKRFANLAENIAYGSLTTNIVNNIRGNQQQAIKDYIAGLMDKWSQLPAKEAGDLFRWAVNDNFEQLYKVPMDLAMNDLRQAVPGRIVEATKVFRQLQMENSKVRDYLKTVFEKKLDKNPDVFNELISLMDPAKSKQALPRLSLDAAMEFKTAHREIGEKRFNDKAGTQLAMSAKTMSGKVDEMIRGSLDGMPDLQRSYTSAMEKYGEGLRLFKGQAVAKFMQAVEKEPGTLVNLIAKPGQVEFISNLKEMVGDQMWAQVVQPRVSASMLYKAFGTPNASGQLTIEGSLSGKKLATELQTLANDGTAQAIMGQKGYTQLLDLAKVIDHVASEPKGAGRVFIQLTQAGAIGAVVGGIGTAINPFSDSDTKGSTGSMISGAGILILMGPRMLGKLVASPEYIEAFKTGLKQTSADGKASPRFVNLLNQLAATQTAHSLDSAKITPENTPLPKPKLYDRDTVKRSIAPGRAAGITPEP